MDLLEQRDADVASYDPYVPVISPTREQWQFAGRICRVEPRSDTNGKIWKA
jgi:hypothetical protein